MLTPHTVREVTRLFLHVFRVPAMEDVYALPMGELRARYRRIGRWAWVVVPCAFAVVTMGFYLLLVVAAAWVQRPVAGAPIIIRPGWGEFASLAVAFGFAQSTATVLRLLRQRLGEDEFGVYAVYLAHRTSPHYPFDVAKLFRWASWALSPLVVATAVLAVDRYTAFTDVALVENPFWSIGRRTVLPYSAIAAIYEVHKYRAHTSGGEPYDVVAWHEVIVFEDGSKWGSPKETEGDERHLYWAGAQLASQRSGVAVQKVEYTEEAEE